MNRSKYLILLMSGLIAASSLSACSTAPPPKKAPEPVVEKVVKEEPPVFPSFYEEPPEVKEVAAVEGTKQYQVGDLMVIHRPTPDNDIVSVRLVMIGGTASYPRSKAGIELLSQTVAVEGGTKTTPRDALVSQLNQMGSDILSYASNDSSGYQFTSVLESFEPTWDLFQQVVFEPAMPEAEIEKTRAQLLARISSRLDSPDEAVGYIATELMFKDHPYSNVQEGTTESVKSLTRDEIIAFQQDQLDASKMILVVVGNVPEEKLMKKIGDSFGRLKGSGEKIAPMPPVVSKPNSDVVLQRELPTTYILGMTTAPPATSPDFYPFVLANAYLKSKLFEEIRSKRNLTYAVSAGASLYRTPYGYLYVTAVKPVETLNEMYKVIATLKENPITQEELTETLNTYITRTYMGLQTNQSQAAFLSSRQVIFENWKEADEVIERLKQVTTQQIQEVAQKYLKGYRFGVVGPLDKLPPTLFDQDSAPPTESKTEGSGTDGAATTPTATETISETVTETVTETVAPAKPAQPATAQ